MSADVFNWIEAMDVEEFSGLLTYVLWQATQREQKGENIAKELYENMAILQMMAEARECQH